MHWEDQSNLEKMLHASLQLLNDPELPVRVCAALALPETTRYSQGAHSARAIAADLGQCTSSSRQTSAASCRVRQRKWYAADSVQSCWHSRTRSTWTD